MDFENRFKDAFGNSLKNKYHITGSYIEEIEDLALNEAKLLHRFLGTNEMSKGLTRTLIIHTRNRKNVSFQSTSVEFKNLYDERCNIEFSVPLDFSASIRLWTIDFKGRKIWSTFTRIRELECDPVILFDFFGKYTHRYSREFMAAYSPLVEGFS